MCFNLWIIADLQPLKDQNQPIANRSGGSHQKVIISLGRSLFLWRRNYPMNEMQPCIIKAKGKINGGILNSSKVRMLTQWWFNDIRLCAPLYYALRASSKENERSRRWNYPLTAPRAFERFLIRREMNNRLPMYFGIIIQMSCSQGSCNLASGFGCDYKSAKYFVLVVKTRLHLRLEIITLY